MGSLKRRIIEDMEPKEEPPMEVLGWIPVRERLPKVGDDVLVHTEFEIDAWRSGTAEHVAHLCKDGQWREQVEYNMVSVVTHWMKLPAPPEVK